MLLHRPPFLLLRFGARAMHRIAPFLLRRFKPHLRPPWLERPHKCRLSLLGLNRAGMSQFFPRNDWHFTAARQGDVALFA
jgi:hypothetical protein